MDFQLQGQMDIETQSIYYLRPLDSLLKILCDNDCIVKVNCRKITNNRIINRTTTRIQYTYSVLFRS